MSIDRVKKKKKINDNDNCSKNGTCHIMLLFLSAEFVKFLFQSKISVALLLIKST